MKLIGGIAGVAAAVVLTLSGGAKANGLAQLCARSVAGINHDDANRERDIEDDRARQREAERRAREDDERSRREEERRAAEDVARARARSARWYGDNR